MKKSGSYSLAAADLAHIPARKRSPRGMELSGKAGANLGRVPELAFEEGLSA